MILHVKDAEYVQDHRIWVRFNDGAECEVDLKDELYGEVFEPLRDLNMFRSFWVDPDLGTIVWKNGADLAPEFLYEKMRILA